VQPCRFLLVRGHVVAVTDPAVLADDGFLFYDRSVDNTTRAHDGIEEHYRVPDHRALLNHHPGRQHAALHLAIDNAASPDQAPAYPGAAMNVSGRPLLAEGMDDPGRVVEVECGRVV